MKEDKYVLVTGAGSGLGRELATAFLDRGHNVVLVGRTKEKLLHYRERFDEDRALAIQADVSVQEQVERVFSESNRWRNRPHVVVSCAGEGVFGEVGSFSQEDVRRVLAGSLIGTILVSQRAFVEMRNQGGYIVNVMSTAAMVARLQESIYCASKWGARGFTECLRLEAKKTPVKIVSVYPGGMKTPFRSERAGMQPNTSAFMEPSEVAGVIVDNVLNKSSLYVTDMVINRI